MQLPRYIREDEDEDFDLESLLNDYVYDDFIQVAARQFGFQVKTPSNKPPYIRTSIQLPKAVGHTNGFTYTHAYVAAGVLPTSRGKGVWIRIRAQRFIDDGMEERVNKPGRYTERFAGADEDLMYPLSSALNALLPRLQKTRCSTAIGLYKVAESLGYWRPKN